MTQTTQRADAEMQACIQNCIDCHRICLETVRHCLEQGGEHDSATHVGLLLDCAEICQTSANFMIRTSPLHGFTCRACSEVCERCAADCESFGDDTQMQECAQTCRRCAESCRRMAAVMATG